MAETLPGGKYLSPDGSLHDANGKAILPEPKPEAAPAPAAPAEPPKAEKKAKEPKA